MHNSTAKPQHLNWVKASLLLLCVSFSLASGQAFAVVENNLTCSAMGNTGIVHIGSVTPGQTIQTSLTANCRVTRAFPGGASLSQNQFYNTGAADGPKFYAFHLNSGRGVPEGTIGTPSSACMPSSCVRLAVGTTFPYEVVVGGPAPQKPGYYVVSVNLYATSVSQPAYGDYLQAIVMDYTVEQPACTMSSANTLNLAFGTLSSSDFANAQQVANVTLNCTRGTQATATLVPTQSAVSGSPGVSATTLAGLSMVATWADDNSAVTFNSPRTLALTAGTNNVSLGFQPRLNDSVSPTGSFSSQYTLNITYL
jgi:hypothetical protein